MPRPLPPALTTSTGHSPRTPGPVRGTLPGALDRAAGLDSPTSSPSVVVSGAKNPTYPLFSRLVGPSMLSSNHGRTVNGTSTTAFDSDQGPSDRE